MTNLKMVFFEAEIWIISLKVFDLFSVNLFNLWARLEVPALSWVVWFETLMSLWRLHPKSEHHNFGLFICQYFCPKNLYIYGYIFIGPKVLVQSFSEILRALVVLSWSFFNLREPLEVPFLLWVEYFESVWAFNYLMFRSGLWSNKVSKGSSSFRILDLIPMLHDRFYSKKPE